MELVDSSSSSGHQDLPNFLSFLYDGLEGYISTATKKLGDSVEFSRQSFKWPSQREELTAWIKANSNLVDVYVAPAIFSEASGRKEHFKASNVVWSEFDGHIPTDDDMGTIPSPSMRIRSSKLNNEHWYWRLDEPITDSHRIDSINRALTYQLGADTSGWDCNQILRPPGTFNFKYDNPIRVTILEVTEDTFSPVGLDVLPAYDISALDELETAEIPDVQEVIFKYVWPKDVSEFFRSKPVDGSDRSAMLMRLGYYLAEMRLSDVEMFAVLRNADDRWGKFKDRTDRNRRLSDLIVKARLKYPSEVDIGEDVIPLFGVSSFLQTVIEIAWIIEGLLQEQGYMLLTGPAGVGKTQFSLRVAINLALGRDFLGFKVTRPCRILFWSLEMGHADLKFFISTMCDGFSAEDMLLLEQNLIIAPIGEAYYLDDKMTQIQFREILDTLDVDGVFIDSVGSTTSSGISDETTVKALMDFNDKLRKEKNVFTWYIHHNRKAQGDNKKPNKLADVYGNQYLVNRATSVYCLWPQNKTIEVIPLKKRLAPMEDSWHITRFGNIDFRRTSGVQAIVDTKETVINLEEIVDELEKEYPVSLERGFNNGFGDM